MQDRRRILWVELGSDVPALVGNLDNFHEVGGGIDAHALHAGPLVLLLILVVELVAMAVALADCK